MEVKKEDSSILPYVHTSIRNRRSVGVLALTLLLSAAAVLPTAAQESQYKRRGLNAMVKIVEGEYDEAIADLERHLQIYPEDPEFFYGLAVAYTQKEDLERALHYARRALEAGLPAARLLAGPRALLRPLTETDAFQELLQGHRPRLLHGPLLGSVTDRSARFWVRTAEEASVLVLVHEASGRAPARPAWGQTRSQDDFTTTVTVRGLEPDTPYLYRVLVDGEEAAETWRFRTFPPEGEPARFQVGFGGGAGYTPWNERMWTTIAAHDLPAFLMMGDNVYIDHPEMPDIQRYTYYRRQSRPEFQNFAAETALFAIWDDHDFAANDSWGGPEVDEPAWKIPVWQIFRQNWNNPAYGGGPDRPGTWFDFSIADVDFFLLDGRYYRTDPSGPDPSMLGPVQKAWLLDRLRASDATFKVIASPVPWAFGAKKGTQMTPEGPQPGALDTWAGFPDEREEIFSFLERHEIEGVVLLSADRHRSDLWKIERPGGYDLYEFESSKLTNMHTHEVMPEALFGYNDKHSFGLLTFDTTRPDPEVTYRIVSIDDEVVYSFTVKRSQLQKD